VKQSEEEERSVALTASKLQFITFPFNYLLLSDL
jgi:hypothetical protein